MRNGALVFIAVILLVPIGILFYVKSQFDQVTNLVSHPDSAHVSSTANGLATPEKLFERFKALDHANDPHIIDLYSDDANIYMMGKHYSRSEYATFIAGTYKMAPNVNALTQYDTPGVSQGNPDEAHVKFHASAGPASLTVDWTLKRRADGIWQIAREESTPGIH